MKASEARRAAILVAAREALDGEIAEALPDDKPEDSWDYRGMRLGIADLSVGTDGDFNCCDIYAWLDIDIVTGRLLVPMLRQLIDDELLKLGVEM